MAQFSFERYMDDAIGVEYGDETAILPINVQSEQPDNDKVLGGEADAVARALRSANVQPQTTVVERVPIIGLTERPGWNLTELAPIEGGYQAGQDWLVLTRRGIYFCTPQIPGMPPYGGHTTLVSPNADVAKGIYSPEHGTVINNETVRYGLARLVARHSFEIDGLSEVFQVA